MSIEKDQVQLLIDECRYGVAGKWPAIEVANDLLNSCCDNLAAMLVERDQLKAQIEALTATGKFLGASVDILGPRCDQLKEEVEALIKRCDRYAQDPSGSKIAAIYAAAHGHLLDIHIIDKSGKSQALDAVFALRKDAERYRWLRNGSDYSVAVHEGPELDKVIDRAMSEADKQ